MEVEQSAAMRRNSSSKRGLERGSSATPIPSPTREYGKPGGCVALSSAGPCASLTQSVHGGEVGAVAGGVGAGVAPAESVGADSGLDAGDGGGFGVDDGTVGGAVVGTDVGAAVGGAVTGQTRVMHERLISSLSQLRPPNVALRVIVRRRHCVPVPHVLVHFSHGIQELVVQWTGFSTLRHT